jgi:hypothetical protein
VTHRHAPRGPRLLAVAVGCAALAGCARPSEEPRCRAVPPTILVAESVPTARLVPCVSSLPDGWAVDAFRADDEEGTFTLEHEDGPLLRVVLRRNCVIADDPVVGEPPAAGVTQRMSTGGDGSVRWTTTLPGGCVVETLTLPSESELKLDPGIHEAIDLVPREDLERESGSPS